MWRLIVGTLAGGVIVMADVAGAAAFWLPPIGANTPTVAVAVGDSITLGTLADGMAVQPYPAVLQALLQPAHPGFVVLNRGKGGETTSEGLARLPAILASARPGFVLIMEGTNDATFGKSPSDIVANLRAMIQLAKANSVIPILGAIIPNHRDFAAEARDIIAEVNALLPGVAAAEGVRFVNTFSPMNDPGLYGSDDLHPTQEGYQVLAAAWQPAVSAAIDDAQTLLEGFYVNSTFDFDGDGRADLGVYRRTTGDWLIYGSQDGPFSAEWGSPMLGDIPVPADYDGDGRADVSIYRSTSGEWFILRSSDGVMEQATWGNSFLDDLPVPADYDGDGQADIAVYRHSTGEWFILQSSNGLFVHVIWGAPGLGDLPVPGRYDADGRADVAVYRGTTGQWFIRRSTDGNLTVGWGSPTLGDRPVPADYDGDGRTDIAVYRGTTGQWFILRSSDEGSSWVAWGAPALADVPVPADYDGDGRADVTVYRPATSEWFTRGSSDGPLAASWGAASLFDMPLPQPARLR